MTKGVAVTTLTRSGPDLLQLAKLIITARLLHLFKSIDAKRTITGGYAFARIVDMILTDYQTYTIEEILKVLGDLQVGKYGTFYERLQGPEIKEAFRIYEKQERADNLAKYHRNLAPEQDTTQDDQGRAYGTLSIMDEIAREGITPSQWLAQQEVKRRQQRTQDVIERANKLIKRSQASRQEKIEVIADRAEAIFEKQDQGKRLTIEERQFLVDHNIPL